MSIQLYTPALCRVTCDSPFISPIQPLNENGFLGLRKFIHKANKVCCVCEETNDFTEEMD